MVPTIRPSRSQPPSGERSPASIRGLRDAVTRRLDPHAASAPEPPAWGEDHTLPSGTCVGRYGIVAHLGGGGMGMVYEAWDPQLGRAVALKVLREGRADVADLSLDAQLLVEAQTLAKIEHPNIVSVYDAGVTAERVFIAMQLCRGQDLHHWLAAGEHTTEQVLAVFVAAGRGLAAAHRMGVVHRDFKPANVLLGEDGSVRVADFGTARLVEWTADVEHEVTASSSDHGRPASRIVGTPTYMAPEQLLGRVGDHRMDQFSFCQCLYGALLGHPPFAGRTFQERRRVVPLGLAGPERERLLGARHVPRRVRRAVLRGLSVEPDDRFESMDALLDALVVRPAARGRLVALALVVLALGLELGRGLAAPHAGPTPCDDVSAALGGTWDDERRRALAAAMTQTGHPDAAERIERVTGALDQYAHAWEQAHADACRTTWVSRIQPTTTLERRRRCLERRRAQLGLAVETMMGATDPTGLDARMPLPFRLPSIDECSDVHALERDASWLPDPRVAALVQRLDEADARREVGMLPEGLALARAAVAEARALGEPAMLARALECLGRLQADGESPEAAEHTLREALELGTLAHDARIVARAWPSLLYVLVLRGELQAAEGLSFAARLAVDAAADPVARGWLLNNLGILHSELGHHDQARQHLLRALEVKRRLHGAEGLEVAITWSNLGFVLGNAGRWSTAADAFERAQAILAATVGASHPLHDVARTGLCRVAIARERHEIALDLCTEALHRLEATSTSPVLESRVRVLVATALWGLGRGPEALAVAQHARAQVDPRHVQALADIDAWIERAREQQAARDSAALAAGR